ncbi:hypothetical protein ACGFZZ_17095 [Streptomyces tendae]
MTASANSTGRRRTMDAIERYRPKLPGPVWTRDGPECRLALLGPT